MASLFEKLVAKDRAWRKSYEVDLSTPENRQRAQFYLTWIDHGFLRRLWTNQAQIAPGVFRSNHPTEKRFKELKQKGIVTILNLRGASMSPAYLLERELCDKLGVTLVDLPMLAYAAPPRDLVLELADVLQSLPKPFLMHCKSGADRTGLASAIYLLLVEGASLDEAKKMLSLKYAHNRWSKTGILDFFLDCYGAALRETRIGFLDWIKTDYDPVDIQARFDARRGKQARVGQE